MSTLHLVNSSPSSDGSLAACLRSASDGDAVLLFEDGVYAALATVAAALRVPAGVQLHVLEPDARARGLTGRMQDDILGVDHDGFVRLTVEHERVVTWL